MTVRRGEMGEERRREEGEKRGEGRRRQERVREEGDRRGEGVRCDIFKTSISNQI